MRKTAKMLGLAALSSQRKTSGRGHSRLAAAAALAVLVSSAPVGTAHAAAPSGDITYDFGYGELNGDNGTVYRSSLQFNAGQGNYLTLRRQSPINFPDDEVYTVTDFHIFVSPELTLDLDPASTGNRIACSWTFYAGRDGERSCKQHISVIAKGSLFSDEHMVFEAAGGSPGDGSPMANGFAGGPEDTIDEFNWRVLQTTADTDGIFVFRTEADGSLTRVALLTTRLHRSDLTPCYPSSTSGGIPCPYAVQASAPTGLVAAAGDATAEVSWLAPDSDGGTPIAGYTVESSPGGVLVQVPASRTTARIPGLQNGTPYTFSVTAITNYDPGLASVASAAVTPQAGAASPSTASGYASAAAGGSTPTNNGALPTASTPLTTGVSVPPGTAGGPITITQVSPTAGAPSGYAFLGQQVNIDAPLATWDNPLRLTFDIDPSLIPAGQDFSTLRMLRNGVDIADCLGQPTANPDGSPCITTRQALPGGGARLIILTPHASRWNWSVDTLAPSVTVSSPAAEATYLLNARVPVSYTCADSGSGVASCAGPVPAGGALDTSSVGAKTFTVTAVDRAGNRRVTNTSYRVLYDFQGFLSPLGPSSGINVVRAGTRVPIPFTLGGNQGLNIFASGYPQVAAVACPANAVPTLVTESLNPRDPALEYNPKKGRYTYALDTSKRADGTCQQLTVKLADGTDHTALFRLTK